MSDQLQSRRVSLSFTSGRDVRQVGVERPNELQIGELIESFEAGLRLGGPTAASPSHGGGGGSVVEDDLETVASGWVHAEEGDSPTPPTPVPAFPISTPSPREDPPVAVPKPKTAPKATYAKGASSS